MSKDRSANDQRSDVKNPNNNDHKQNQDNRSAQIQTHKESIKRS